MACTWHALWQWSRRWWRRQPAHASQWRPHCPQEEEQQWAKQVRLELAAHSLPSHDAAHLLRAAQGVWYQCYYRVWYHVAYACSATCCIWHVSAMFLPCVPACDMWCHVLRVTYEAMCCMLVFVMWLLGAVCLLHSVWPVSHYGIVALYSIFS